MGFVETAEMVRVVAFQSFLLVLFLIELNGQGLLLLLLVWLQEVLGKGIPSQMHEEYVPKKVDFAVVVAAVAAAVGEGEDSRCCGVCDVGCGLEASYLGF
jgi:hypothetical protein